MLTESSYLYWYEVWGNQGVSGWGTRAYMWDAKKTYESCTEGCVQVTWQQQHALNKLTVSLVSQELELELGVVVVVLLQTVCCLHRVILLSASRRIFSKVVAGTKSWWFEAWLGCGY